MARDPTSKARTGVADQSIFPSVVAVSLLFTAIRCGISRKCTTTFGTTTARNPAVLFPLVKDGKISGRLGHCAKTGQYFILDRRTGDPIFAVTEQHVLASVPGAAFQLAQPTQPYSTVEPITR